MHNTDRAVFLDEEALARRWGISRRTLANQRSAGRSPLPYVKIGRSVRYLLSDVQAAERRVYGGGR